MHKLHRIILNILPLAVLSFVGMIRGFFVKTRSYSQYGEDLIVVNFFKKIGVAKGVYVDVGAFHPTWISNTKLLHDLGWSGYVVDIDTFKLWAFKLVRGARCKLILGAVGNDDALRGKRVSAFKFKRFLSEIDTLDKSVAQKYASDWNYAYVEASVPYLPVNDLFEGKERIDLLNIDIEGLDTLILSSLDFDRVRPSVIVFEDNETWGGCENIKNILSDEGYDLLFLSGGSIGYYRRDLIN